MGKIIPFFSLERTGLFRKLKITSVDWGEAI